jgi:hypothetical protein
LRSTTYARAVSVAAVASRNRFLRLYTDLLYTTAKLTLLAARERSTTDYAPPARDARVSTARVDYLSSRKSYELAMTDYDAMPEENLPNVAAKSIEWLQRLVPVTDNGEPWANVQEAIVAIDAKFAKVLGAPEMRFANPSDDEAFRWFCTQSVIAHRLERAPSGDEYCIPLDFLRNYEMRDGAEPLGSTAYFSSDLRPLRIVGFRGTTVRPGDPNWPQAMFHFRCSAALCVTLVDHAVYAHFSVGNALVVATREALPVDHPLRRLLSPFQIKTVGINRLASVTLVGRGAIIHRLTGLTWNGLTQVYADAQAQTRFETVPELLARNGTSDLGGRYAWGQDALDLWNALESFVARYLALYFDESIASYPELTVWQRRLADLLPPALASALPIRTRAELTRLITTIVWVVTGWHHHVAIPSDMARTPEFFAYYVPANARSLEQMWPTKERTELNMLLVALTSPSGPRLMEDFSQYMLDAEARDLVRSLQRELGLLSDEIRVRNDNRDFPLRTFDPRGVEISVST